MILRPARPDDAGEMSVLLNKIIAAGGTTAYQTAYTAAGLHDLYIVNPRLIACHVAAEETDGILGFQAIWYPVKSTDPMPGGWCFIATFVRQDITRKGIGLALFSATSTAACAAGLTHIDATIRADNSGGQAYYAKQGFIDYDILKAVPLEDGSKVDRIRKVRAL